MAPKVRYTTELWAREREERYFQVLTHILVPGDFYEPLTQYQPSLEYYSLVRSLLPQIWRIVRDGIWFYCLPPTRKARVQGWKIHISAIKSNAEAILQAVIPVLIRSNMPFKFALDGRILQLLNEKWWLRGSSGKFITIYPQSDAQFFFIVRRLYKILHHFEGPYILSDRRYKDCKVLYYRWGGFEAPERLTPLGSLIPSLVSPEGSLIDDIRNPFFSLPSWVKDPFSNKEDGTMYEENSKDITLNKRYKVKKALSISNTGGIYIAQDQFANQEIILKEARPHTGTSAPDLLRKEERILKKLIGMGYNIAPKPIELFYEWEHLFLAEEYINGIPLTIYTTVENPILAIHPSKEAMQRRLGEVCTIAQQITKALEILHNMGIIFGDLSPNNVLLLREGRYLTVKLVDFEGAYEVGMDTPVMLFTPGFGSKKRLKHLIPTPKDDYYGLGSLLLFLLFPVNALLDLDPDKIWYFLKEMEKDFGLPATLTELICKLLDSSVEHQPNIVQQELERIKLHQCKVLLHKSTNLPTEKMLQDTVEGVCQFILRHADLTRRDRLFPCDPAVKNPLSVDHGALGVMYALYLMGQEIPDTVFKWVKSFEISSGQYPPGLYSGLSGIAWVFSVLGETDLAIKIWNKAYSHPLLYETWDIYSGAAGCGLTALHLWRATQERQFLEQAIVIGEAILGAARKNNKRGLYWPSRERFIGYAHGASGIALFLLYLYCVTRDEKFVEYGRKALNFDLSYIIHTPDGFLSLPPDASNVRVMLPYWEFGSAGVGTSVLYYFLATGEKGEDLKPILDGLIGDTMRKYTVFPGLFGGLAGLGNFLLNCYVFLGNPLYLEAAKRAARGLLLYKIERPDGIAFPGENLYRLSTDFATGSAGIGLFLHRLQRLGPDFNFTLDDLIAQYLEPERHAIKMASGTPDLFG